MPLLDESSRPPADSERNELLALILLPFRAAFRFLFRCRHRRVTLPFNDHQTCLDCGSTRPYIFHSTFEFADAGIEIGPWRKPRLPRSNTAAQVARRSVEMSPKVVSR